MKMLRSIWHLTACVVAFCLVQVCIARSATSTATSYQNANSIAMNMETTTSQKQPATASPTIWKDLSLVYRIYQQCANENLSVCLKVKLLTGLERVLRSAKTLKIIDGVQFVKQDADGANAQMQTPSKPIVTEQEIDAVLPRAMEAKEQALNAMLFQRLSNFLQEHTLQVKFSAADYAQTDEVESRKKKDKKGGGAYIMIPLLLGGTFVPIAYGALAMLAGKALIVSKLALVLASIIGIKKLLGGGGGGKESHEVVVSGGHSGWGREFDLAYNGWKPTRETRKVQ